MNRVCFNHDLTHSDTQTKGGIFMAQDVLQNSKLTPLEEEAVRLFRMISPARRAAIIAWLSEQASAPTRIYIPPQ